MKALPKPPTSARQLLLGDHGGLGDAATGTLTRWERDAGSVWRAVGEPVQIVVGQAGLAWGRGLERRASEPRKRESPTPAPATTCPPAHLVLRAWRSGAPERLHETILGRRFAVAPGGGKRTVADTTLRAGERRTLAVPLARLGEPGAPDRVRLEVRLVYTIDEFPFPGRELAGPTYRTLTTQDLDLPTLPVCKCAPLRPAS